MKAESLSLKLSNYSFRLSPVRLPSCFSLAAFYIARYAFKNLKAGDAVQTNYTKPNLYFNKRRLTFLSIVAPLGIVLLLGGARLFWSPFLPLTSAPDEPQARENLRKLTRGGALPNETAIQNIISNAPHTPTTTLANIVLARIKFAARDFNGAVSLLSKNSRAINQQTSLGDYALQLRADALAQSGRRDEARALYEQLANEFPNSLLARRAIIKAAEISLGENHTLKSLQNLIDADDGAVLLLAAKTYERQNDMTRALAAYRRIYFYAPASLESADAAAALARLNSSTAPANADEANTRAEKLFAAKRYNDAAQSYGEAFAAFPNTANDKTQLHRGLAAYNVGTHRLTEAVIALNAISSGSSERAEALFYLAQANAKAHQWSAAHAATNELQRNFANSKFTSRSLVAAGQVAKDAKATNEAASFFRTAVNAYPRIAETASAQFELAWMAHDAKNYNESARLLLEHLAFYTDKNTDFRGRAAYWAGRDAERVRRMAEARAIYQAMQARYDANWYGQLAKQRLNNLPRNAQTNFDDDSPVSHAVENLQTVTVADETANTPEVDARLAKADELAIVGLDREAIEELNRSLELAPDSPRLNLAKARLFRARDENLQALNALKRSYPDFSQMKPEELTRDEWDVFYPLEHWETIVQEARARNLDPYTVAGLIRQESIFDPRAISGAHAYGLMQLLVPTAQVVARKVGVGRAITIDALFEPNLNIQLGTTYLREQLDRFGRIEYVAAAYNAGPGRVVQWRASLPSEIDEWADAIPFKETRGYVQGVTRNTLQYKRLYDAKGEFRPEVGTHTARRTVKRENINATKADTNARPRRVVNEAPETILFLF